VLLVVVGPFSTAIWTGRSMDHGSIPGGSKKMYVPLSLQTDSGEYSVPYLMDIGSVLTST
jgi:hypothetical protein